MTRRLEFGEGILDPALAPKLIKALPAARTASPPIQRGRYTRNGQAPDIALINSLNEQTNQGVLYRAGEVFRCVGNSAGLLPPSSVSATRARWRFSFHTGKYTHSLLAMVCLIPQDSNPGNNTYARLDISTSATYATTASTAKFFHGASQGGTAAVPAGWDALKPIVMYLDVDPDTDYYGIFYDIDSGRLMSATVIELTSMTEHFSGYLPQHIPVGGDVLDVYRENLVTLQYNLWRRGGATVMNWTVDGDDVSAPYGSGPIATTSSTQTNIVDTSSTTVTAATPGWTFDMTGKERLSQSATGVPCRLEVFGKLDAAGADGNVYLKDSAGATVTSIVGQWTSSTATWKSVTFNLPASAAKYDIHFSRSTGGRTFTMYAANIYEYGA